MTRNLKALGLVLMVAFAFGGMAASGASAGVLTSAGGQGVTFTDTETGGTLENSVTAFGGVTHCPGSTVTGHKATTTPHELIPNNATSITLTAHLKSCVTEEGANKFPVTVDMNGCDFLVTIGANVNGGTYETDLHIVCPAGKFIQITAFSSAAHSLRVCTLTITSTTPTSDVHVTNGGGSPSDIYISGTFTNIEVHKSGLCGSATDKSVVTHVHGTIKGLNKAGESTGISVSG
jgi:hypothetical protein